MRDLSRNVPAAALLVILVFAAACRGERTNATPGTRDGVGAARAESCDDRLGRLRADLERTPRERHYDPIKLLDLPEAPPSAPPTTQAGRLLLLREEYLEYAATPWQWNDTASIGERIVAGESSTPPSLDMKPVLYALFANRTVSVKNVAFVMRTVADARGKAPTEFELMLQRREGTYQPYTLPTETPDRVKQLHRDLGDIGGAGAYEEELARANRGCATFGAALTDQWGPRSLSDHRLRADVLQALQSCQCSGVDVEIVAGLLFAATGHVTPYASCRISLEPVENSDVITLSADATVADLVAKIRATPELRPVQLVIE